MVHFGHFCEIPSPSSPHSPPLVTTNVIYFLCISLLLKYDCYVVPITQNSDSIFLYFLKWSYRLTKLSSVTKARYYIVVHCIPTLYISYSWLIYFTAGTLYLSLPHLSSPHLLPSGYTRLFSVSFMSVSVCYAFAFVLDSTYKWNWTVFVILWFYLMTIPLTQDLKF